MDKRKKNDTVLKMTTQPVGPLIISLAVPTIISMLVTNLYNTADTYFVSQLGTSASGAVGIIFSIMTMIQAVGFTIGMGSGSIVSRLIGGNDVKTASKFTSSAIICSLVLGSLLGMVGIIFQNQLIMRLGATETILPYAKDYAKFILIGTPFMATSFVMNNQLRFQGKAKYGMFGLTTGGILNIALDPLFIFVFDFGIKGAAIATLVSQCTSFTILLSAFLRKKSLTELSIKNISKNLSDYILIIKTGLPSFFRQGMATVAMIFLNLQTKIFGALSPEVIEAANRAGEISETTGELITAADCSIAAMAITNRVFMLLMSIAIGLGQGYQPVCGMNLGAQKYDRVRKAFKFLLKITFLLMSVFAIAVFIFAPEITLFFRKNEAVVLVASLAMRSQAVILPFHAIIFATNMTLQTAGRTRAASFTSVLRQGLFFIPLILILPHFIGLLGIQITQALSDLLTAFVSLPFAVHFFKTLDNEEGIKNEK